eukprot:890854_1
MNAFQIEDTTVNVLLRNTRTTPSGFDYQHPYNHCSGYKTLHYQSNEDIILYQRSAHSLSLISSAFKRHCDIDISNGSIVSLIHHNEYLILLTETTDNHSPKQQIVILNTDHMMTDNTHQTSNINQIDMNAISEDDIIEILEPDGSDNTTPFETSQQIEHALESLFTLTSNHKTHERKHNEEPSHKKRKISDAKHKKNAQNTPIRKTVIHKTCGQDTVQYQIDIGSNNYFSDDPHSSLISCIHLTHNEQRLYHKLLFVPSATSKSCIQLLLSFTRIINDEQTEIGFDAFKISLSHNATDVKHKKRKINADEDITYELYLIWRDEVLTIQNKINSISTIKNKYKNWMDLEGISDENMCKSWMNIQCTASLFVCCAAENDKYPNVHRIDKKLAMCLFGEVNKNIIRNKKVILLTGWSHGKLYWFDVAFYMKRNNKNVIQSLLQQPKQSGYFGKYHGEIDLHHMHQPIHNLGLLQLKDDTQCLCVIGKLGIISLIYANVNAKKKNTNISYSSYNVHLYRTNQSFIASSCIVNDQHLFVSNKNGTLFYVQFVFEANQLQISNEFMDRMSINQTDTPSVHPIVWTPCFITLQVCMFAGCNVERVLEICAQEEELLYLSINGIRSANISFEEVISDRYLEYDPKLEMKQILDHMTHLTSLENNIVCQQRLLNEKLYCRHIAKCIEQWIKTQSSTFSIKVDIDLLATHLQMSVALQNESHIPFDAIWMKHFSVSIMIEYKLRNGAMKVMSHNVPLSYDDIDVFKMENTKCWNTKIILNANLWTYGDIHYYVYLIPHIAMDQYQNESPNNYLQQNSQKVRMPSDHVLLSENTVDLLSLLSHSQVHKCLMIPFDHFKQMEFDNMKQNNIEQQMLSDLIKDDRIKLDTHLEEKEKEETIESEDGSMDDHMMDMNHYNDEQALYRDDFDSFHCASNSESSDSGSNDDAFVATYKVFDCEQDQDPHEIHTAERTNSNEKIILKHEIVIPMPKIQDCVESKWNDLHKQVFGIMNTKCIESQSEDKIVIKGHILSGDLVVIHCEHFEPTKWKIIIQLITHCKLYHPHNEYFLWRIGGNVGKRVWKYYMNHCVRADEGLEENEDKIVDIVDELKHLFDSEESKNISNEKFIQECIGLDEYFLSKLKPLRIKWNGCYANYMERKDTNNDDDSNDILSTDKDDDFIDINLFDSFKNVSLEMYKLFCEYKQKQSQIK